MDKFFNFLKCILLFTLLSYSHLSNASQSSLTTFQQRQKEKQIIDHILDPLRYDKRIRPPFNTTIDGPVVISVNMFIRSILEIDDVKMDFSVQITFRQQWMDDRLHYKHLDNGGSVKYLTLIDSSKIWMPDIFFSNEKESHFHNVILPNEYLRVFPDGNILYSTRITLKLSCPMNLSKMPFDTQICSIKMASYGHTENDIIFTWKSNDPVSVVKNLYLKDFYLQSFRTDYCTSKTNTGVYSCLQINFKIYRIINQYLLQIYFPCIMLILLSWVSFWIDVKAVTARLLLGILTLLSMAFHIARFNEKLPQTSYTKAIDVWTGISLIFVFATILEFATAHYLLRKDQKQNINSKEAFDLEEIGHNGSTTTKTAESQSNVDPTDIERSKNVRLDDSQRSKVKAIYNIFISRIPKTKSKRVDFFARFTFPILFILFITIYWSTYNRKDENV